MDKMDESVVLMAPDSPWKSSAAKRRKTDPLDSQDIEKVEKKILRMHKPFKNCSFRGVYKGDSTIIVADGDVLLPKLQDTYSILRKLARKHDVKFRYAIDMELEYYMPDYYNRDSYVVDNDGYSWKDHDPRSVERDFRRKFRPKPTKKTVKVDMKGVTKENPITEDVLSKFVFTGVNINFKRPSDSEFEYDSGSSYDDEVERKRERNYISYVDQDAGSEEESNAQFAMIVEMKYSVQFRKSYTK